MDLVLENPYEFLFFLFILGFGIVNFFFQMGKKAR